MTADQEAIALANDDVVLILWRYEAAIRDCLGFEVSRQVGGADPNGDWVPLPAWVGFAGDENPKWTRRTTTMWPVQKFEWKDLTAPRGGTYGYRVVPMVGTPGELTRAMDKALYTQTETLTPTRGSFNTYFNRGILSTQFLVHQLPTGPDGRPSYTSLRDHIDQPNDPLRTALAGDLIGGLLALLDRAAQQGGACYAALYELDDPELLAHLLAMPKERLHLILANTGPDDSTNQDAREKLHANGTDITDRFLPANHIGHNKFVVYVDAGNVPKAVLLGSTNWTDTGVCAQSNNALIVESTDLANAYLTYWMRLKDDQDQGPELRSADATPGFRNRIDNAEVTAWFSPNMPHARRRGRTDEATPPDLQQVFDLMEGAQQAILFLVFQPGAPSIVEKAAEIGNDKPQLYIRGAATDPKAVGSFEANLQHRAGQPPDMVVPATAINDQFAYWQRELLKMGPKAHAIVHSKIVVIDPMTPNSVVATGSHNLGFKASYDNDENLLIVRGHPELARAYAVNVMDVYDHYRFRYVVQQAGDKAFSGLARDDGWQTKYFNPADPASRDSKAWF